MAVSRFAVPPFLFGRYALPSVSAAAVLKPGVDLVELPT